MEVGGRGILYTYRYTTTRMTPALRWAVVRAILTFHNCERQSHKIVSTDHNFRRERRAEADSNRGPSAYQPNALPLGQTSSTPDIVPFIHLLYIVIAVIVLVECHCVFGFGVGGSGGGFFVFITEAS